MTLNPRTPVRKKRERSTAERIGLELCDWLRIPLTAFGVDYRVFRLLVEIRLVLAPRKKAGDGPKNPYLDGGLLLSCFLAALMGSVFGLVTLGAASPGTVATVLSLLMTFYGAVLTISIFADLLFDGPTAAFLAGRPVDDRTAFAARVVPASVSVAMVQICLATPMIVISVLRFEGWEIALALSLTAVLNGVFATALVLVVFAAVLRYFSADRFKSIVVKAQLVMTIVMMLAPQIPQFFSRSRQPGEPPFQFDGAWKLLPATWYGGFVDFMTDHDGGGDVVLPILAVVAPFLLLALSFVLVRGKFVSALAGGGVEKSTARRSRSFLDYFAPTIAPAPLERAGFGLATALQMRERGSMLQAVPQLVYAMVIPLGIVGPMQDGFTERIGLLAHGLPVGVIMLIVFLSRTDDPEAAWIYRMSPNPDSSPVVAGAVRATLIRFVALPILSLVILASILGGAIGAMNALVAGAIAWFLATLVARCCASGAPFSMKLDKSAARGSVGIFLGFLVLTMGSLAIQRYFLDRSEHAIPVGLLFAFLGARHFASLRHLRVRESVRVRVKPAEQPSPA